MAHYRQRLTFDRRWSADDIVDDAHERRAHIATRTERSAPQICTYSGVVEGLVFLAPVSKFAQSQERVHDVRP